MITKIAAGWLALLVFLPFTPPFPTCDLGDLIGWHAAVRTVTNVPGNPQTAELAAATSLLAMPLPRSADTLRLQAMRIGSSHESVLPAPPKPFERVASSASLSNEPVIPVTVLRL